MELFTYDRNFKRDKIVDVFTSAIWTDRYYGDDDFELTVPLSMDNIQKLKVGTFVGLDGSNRPKIIENMSIENNLVKVSGIGILPWLNNRFIRHTSNHDDRYWYKQPAKFIGEHLTDVVFEMISWGSYFMGGGLYHGLEHPHQLLINGVLMGLSDRSGSKVTLAIPYGPLYDTLREIAEASQIGMRITLTFDKGQETHWTVDFQSTPRPPETYFLDFTNYKGVDRTSGQSVYPAVRFSPQFDTLANIKELQSAANYKNLIFVFAPSNPGGLANGMAAGRATTFRQNEQGNEINRDPIWSFDVRAMQVFADDITTDQVTTAANLAALLDTRASTVLQQNLFTVMVDGEILPGSDFQYGTDYGLGDIIEVQGNSGVVQPSMVTEYIQSQDATGERSYPTVVGISS